MSNQTGRSNPFIASGPNSGFTLVELLIVIAIIALLVGILVPTLHNAKRLAQRTQCQANLHSIGIGVTAYAVDNQRMLPTYYCASTIPFDTFWMRRNDGGLVNLGLVAEYVGSPASFYCPTQDQESSPSISRDIQDARWQVDSVTALPSPIDAVTRQVLLPQPGANSSYPARSREFEPENLPRWSMLNHANKIIYSDFIGVDNWAATGRFFAALNAPHDSRGCNRLFGDGTVSWANAEPVNKYRTVNAEMPSGEDLKDYYQLLDVLP